MDAVINRQEELHQRGVVGKTPEASVPGGAAFLVTALLPLAIAFQLLRVVLAVLLPIARMSLAPLVRTLPADLPVN
jgi:hypothetical protein